MNLFKHASHSKNINPKITIILIILAGTISSVAYATTTVISDAGIITPALTITTPGGCSGCGASEGSFIHYTTIALNTTFTSAGGTPNICIGNDGGILIAGTTNEYVALNGTLLFSHTTVGNTSGCATQSFTGQYKIISDGDNQLVKVFKNGNLLQTLGLNVAQFGGNIQSITISPDGKYIAAVGSSGGSERAVVFQGT